MENEDKVGLSLQKLLKLLKCSLCLKYMRSPIYQCVNGHRLCEACKVASTESCPTCRVSLQDLNIRCLALEEMAESLIIKCKYKKFGCGQMMPYSDKLIHEQGCESRPRSPFACPCYIREERSSNVGGRSCDVRGDIPLFDSSQFIRMYDFNEIYGYSIIYCLEQYFILRIESKIREGNPIFMIYRGEPHFHDLYGFNGETMIIESTPRGLEETHYSGLLIGTRNEQRKITIAGIIWRSA